MSSGMQILRSGSEAGYSTSASSLSGSRGFAKTGQFKEKMMQTLGMLRQYVLGKQLLSSFRSVSPVNTPGCTPGGNTAKPTAAAFTQARSRVGTAFARPNVTSGARAGRAGCGVRVCTARAASRGSCCRDPRSACRRAGECPRACACAQGPEIGEPQRARLPEVSQRGGRPQEMGTPGEGATTGSRGLGKLSAARRSLWLRERWFPDFSSLGREGILHGEMAPGGEDARLCLLSPRPPIMSFPRLTATAEPLGIQQEAAGGGERR